MKLRIVRRQLPPTAGLPLHWRDLFWGRGNFSSELAQQLDIPHPLLTCSGTAALIIALRALQQRQPTRDEVIVPAFTCPLVALAAHYCPPLRIVPCDLLPDSIDLDPQQLQQLCGPRTLAVLVTHLGGRIANVAAATDIAKPCGAAVIEDAAQALGAKSGEQSVGLAGDIGFFSLALGKGLTTVEGGVLFSRSPALHAELASQTKSDLHWHTGWELRRTIELWAYRLLYHPDRLDLVYGRPQRQALARGDLLAAVGDDFTTEDIPLHSLGAYRQRVAAAALPRLSLWQQENRQRALMRVAQLAQLPGVTLLQDHEHQRGVWPFIMLLMPDSNTRDQVMQQMWSAGLGVTRLFIEALHNYPAVNGLLNLHVATPNAENFAARSLTISNSPWMSDDEFTLILTTLCTVLTQQ